MPSTDPEARTAPPKKFRNAEVRPSRTSSTSNLFSPHKPHDGSRSPAPAAHKAALGPHNPHLRAKILGFFRLRTTPRPIAALVSHNAHILPATAKHRSPLPRPIRRNHRVAHPDFLHQDSQGDQDDFALRRRRHCAFGKHSKRWKDRGRGWG